LNSAFFENRVVLKYHPGAPKAVAVTIGTLVRVEKKHGNVEKVTIRK